MLPDTGVHVLNWSDTLPFSRNQFYGAMDIVNWEIFGLLGQFVSLSIELEVSLVYRYKLLTTWWWILDEMPLMLCSFLQVKHQVSSCVIFIRISTIFSVMNIWTRRPEICRLGLVSYSAMNYRWIKSAGYVLIVPVFTFMSMDIRL